MEFVHTGQILPNQAEDSFAKSVMRISPNGNAPLFAMTGLAKKKFVPTINHGWWTKTMVFPKVVIKTAIAAAGTTAVEVIDASMLVPGSLLRYFPQTAGQAYAAGEVLLVTAINYSTNVLTVQRGFTGTTAKTSIPAGAELVEVGNAYPENSERPRSKSIGMDFTDNYTQIFRNAWDVGGTLAAVKMQVGEDAISSNKADCAFFHAMALELAILFGRKSIGTDPISGKPFHTMGGLEYMLEQHAPSNLKVAAASTTFDQLEAMLDPLFDYRTDGAATNSRVLYVGSQALKVINNIGRLSGQYQLTDGQTGFGLRFQTFKTTRGDFKLVEHPLFNTNNDWKKMAMVLDLSSFDLMYLQGRDTLHDKYNKRGDLTDGRDAEGGVLTTECTFEMVNPLTNGIVYGLTAAAA